MIHIGKITKEDIRKANRKANREAEIAEGLNINRHRVWKNKKAYTRKPKHKKNYE